MSSETDVFPGAAEDVTTDQGMSVSDAATSAFDDADRAHNGIAEGERESVGQYLKYHADAVGTSVISGLNSLIEPAITLRHGRRTRSVLCLATSLTITKYGISQRRNPSQSSPGRARKVNPSSAKPKAWPRSSSSYPKIRSRRMSKSKV